MANHLSRSAKKTVMTENFTDTTMVLDDEPPGSEGIRLATGEEQRTSQSSSRRNEVYGPNPQGSSHADVPGNKTRVRSCVRGKSKIGTWNVRSMYQGKLDIVKREMTRTGIELLRVSKLRWVGRGHFKSEDHTVIYSGHETSKTTGVAVICGKEMAKAVIGYNPISDRILTGAHTRKHFQ